MSKIAALDSKAMDKLMAGERKTAAAGEDPQAFADHEEYLATLDAVLKEDGKESWAPNDMILD